MHTYIDNSILYEYNGHEIDLSVRSKDAPDIITPNPFLKSQSHSLPEWEEYLKTLSVPKAEETILHLIALLDMTKGFEDYRLD